ncbi:MAG: substrate-binding domain-containing protein [Deltaproteobacteria bacterium]|nr:substrate-binding domain-containing protein [Deltaproteobacteria bacterium]MBW2393753.1 substrate-binding domain-containing protein [Deltaproteobacteria bacterium]
MARLFIAIAFLWLAAAASAKPLVVGVSWSNFQEERWKTDEAALREALETAGARYVSADAQSRAEKQLADVESLLARGADVLILVAHDQNAILPAVRMARAEGIPVIAYDRLIEREDVVYLSFDNREVGRMQAREIQKLKPKGRYVFIKGSSQDPNAAFVHQGQLDVLGPALDAGQIVNAGEQAIDDWLPELAQRVMEQILTANDNRVDAVVCSNDGMAGGVIAALRAQGMNGIPVSGQDGDRAALHRVAQGDQAVSVWKDARALGKLAARVALEMGRGAEPGGVVGTQPYRDGPRGIPVPSILLAPIPITRANLGVVFDAGWASKADICVGGGELPPACR